jgi:hypothetical protein
MKHLVMALALLAPLPAFGESLECSLSRVCATDSECRDDEAPVILGVTIADDGKTAQLTFGDDALDMTLVDDSAIGRSFLAVRAGSGIGLVTVGDNGDFAASSNEFNEGALFGSTATGRCSPRNG